MCITDIFTILIRALKCFQLSYLALMPLSLLLRSRWKKIFFLTSFIFGSTNHSERDCINEMAFYLLHVMHLKR